MGLVGIARGEFLLGGLVGLGRLAGDYARELRGLRRWGVRYVAEWIRSGVLFWDDGGRKRRWCD